MLPNSQAFTGVFENSRHRRADRLTSRQDIWEDILEGTSSPPPPPPALAPQPIPWEDTRTAGAVARLIATVKLLATAPGEAFARMPTVGGIGQPLLFAIIVAWIGIAISAAWGLLFGGMSLPFLDRDELGMFGAMMGMSTAMTLGIVILAPIITAIVVFVQAGILHLMLMLVGGANKGFEATARVCSYSQAAQLAQAIPFCGGLLSMVWSLVLLIVGLATAHETTRGKAATAVILPVVLCCSFFAALTMMGVLAGIASSR